MTDGTVGLIGLGNMGQPMAMLLARAGYRTRAFDASSAALEAAASAGIDVASSAADIARTCGTVILMLPSSDIVDAVAGEMLDVDGRVATLFIDMSSSVPARTVALAERCAARDVRLIDAPVSGGVVRARSGELTIMVGGAEEDVQSVEDVLAVLGSRVVRVGEVGAGHATKALNNLLSATHLLATNEAVLAAREFGIDPAVFLEVVNSSSGRSGSSELKLPRYVLTGAFDSGFSAALLEKDVNIALGVEHALGVPAPVSEAAGARWAELRSRLDEGADHTEIIRPVERDLGRELRSHG